MSTRVLLILTTGLLVSGCSTPMPAIVGYRTDGTGVYPSARATTQWNEESGRHIIWKTRLPQYGHGGPVVVGDRIFVTAEPHTLLCVDTASGKILWRRDCNVFDLFPPDTGPQLKKTWATYLDMQAKRSRFRSDMGELKRLHEEKPESTDLANRIEELTQEKGFWDEEVKRLWKILNTEYKGFRGAMWGQLQGYACITPVTDGEHVYVKYGTGVAACYTVNGRQPWATRVEFDAQCTIASSPLLVDGKLIIHRKKRSGKSGVRDGAYTVGALDTRTGEALWETPSLPVPDWGSGTDLVLRPGGVSVVLTISGEVIRVSDGEILARKAWGDRPKSAAGPVTDGRIIVFPDDSDGGKPSGIIRAVTLKEDNGSITVVPLWNTTIRPPGNDKRHRAVFSSPVIHNGRVYAMEEHPVLWILDAATGKVLSETRFEEALKKRIMMWAPVTLAGNTLFAFSQKPGAGLAIDVSGNTPRLVSINPMESCESPAVFMGNRMIVRAKHSLYCIGRQ